MVCVYAGMCGMEWNVRNHATDCLDGKEGGRVNQYNPHNTQHTKDTGTNTSLDERTDTALTLG